MFISKQNPPFCVCVLYVSYIFVTTAKYLSKSLPSESLQHYFRFRLSLDERYQFQISLEPRSLSPHSHWKPLAN